MFLSVKLDFYKGLTKVLSLSIFSPSPSPSLFFVLWRMLKLSTSEALFSYTINKHLK